MTTEFVEITGEVAFVIFSKDSFYIAKVKTFDGDIHTVKGVLYGAEEGKQFWIRGTWENSPRGKQLKVIQSKEIMPKTKSGIFNYLKRGHIKGIGEKTARAIVEKFGTHALDIIKSNPEKLAELPGISRERAEEISEQLKAREEYEEVAVFLNDLPSIGPKRIKTIQEKYRHQAVEIIEKHPYRLMKDFDGIGFETADRIARKVVFDPLSEERIEAMILHTMDVQEVEGHVCIERDKLSAAVVKTFQDIEKKESKEKGKEGKPAKSSKANLTDASQIKTVAESCIQRLLEEQRIVLDSGYYYTPTMLGCENRIADSIERLQSAEIPLWKIDMESIEKVIGKKYAENQRKAVLQMANNAVGIVTGGPGTGKTTVIRGILEAAKQNGVEKVAVAQEEDGQIVLCAPTGRASKRITETTDMFASTFHKLLEYDQEDGGFKRNQNYPIDAELIIADEFSMVGLKLGASWFDAIPSGARVVIVGDVHQLPSVEAGDVLNHLILSHSIPTVVLDHVYRTGEGSMINVNAQKILNGELPTPAKEFLIAKLTEDVDEDFVFKRTNDALKWLLSSGYRFDDIQILAPKKKGKAGVYNINQKVQNVYNPKHPGAPEFEGAGGTVYRIKDKVMQRKNRNDVGIMNGEIGSVFNVVEPEAWELEEGSNPKDFLKLQVGFEGELYDYTKEDTDSLTLAYCSSIHKSQGSEFPVVIVMLLNEAMFMLSNNLFYTAVTRGKKQVIIICQEKALKSAVRKKKRDIRRSLLSQRIIQKCGKKVEQYETLL